MSQDLTWIVFERERKVMTLTWLRYLRRSAIHALLLPSNTRQNHEKYLKTELVYDSN